MRTQTEEVGVFLETDRLVLRRFTAADVDLLVELDGDPEVMRFLTGGRATPRAIVRDDILPTFLRYYEWFAGFGFWAAVQKPTGEFLGWFTSGRHRSARRTSSSDTGCAGWPGVTAMPPKVHGRSSARVSPSSVCSVWWRRP